MKLNYVYFIWGVISISGYAQARQFEYLNVDYTVQSEFMAKVRDLGAQGWELASCVTSNSSSYDAFTSNGETISGLKFARTSYCIFKREIDFPQKP